MPTLVRLDIGNQTFYGISTHGQTITLRVNNISVTHAEADAFQQAADAGVQATIATLYVDYPDGLRGACGDRGAVKSMAKQIGVTTLTIVYPGGIYIISTD